MPFSERICSLKRNLPCESIGQSFDDTLIYRALLWRGAKAVNVLARSRMERPPFLPLGHGWMAQTQDQARGLLAPATQLRLRCRSQGLSRRVFDVHLVASSRSHAPVGQSNGLSMVTPSTGYQRPRPRIRAGRRPFLLLIAITCPMGQLTLLHPRKACSHREELILTWFDMDNIEALRGFAESILPRV
jgi:hypothetical protein